jgi:DNA-directed RNA polymerase I, II, and III subunit RPABC2
MSYFQDSDDNDSIKSSGSENEDSDVELDTKINKQKPKTVVLAGEEELGDDESIPDDDEVEEEEDDDDSVPDDDDEEDDDVGKGVDQPDDNYDEEDVDGDVSSGEEEEGEPKRAERKKKITIASSNVGKKGTVPKISDLNLSDDDDEDEEGELYLKKFDKDINDNYLLNFHPECALHNYDEVLTMTKVIRDKSGIIIDDLHKTIPYLTKYERARILGQRAKQINSGATVFIKVPENVIDGYLIAELELKEKRIPFIIRRPLPNGGSEYWSVRDLENIIF